MSAGSGPFGFQANVECGRVRWLERADRRAAELRIVHKRPFYEQSPPNLIATCWPNMVSSALWADVAIPMTMPRPRAL